MYGNYSHFMKFPTGFGGECCTWAPGLGVGAWLDRAPGGSGSVDKRRVVR